MNLEQIWRQIRQVKAWFNIQTPSIRGGNEEILKPLDRIIDFEQQELIYNNHVSF